MLSDKQILELLQVAVEPDRRKPNGASIRRVIDPYDRCENLVEIRVYTRQGHVMTLEGP